MNENAHQPLTLSSTALWAGIHRARESESPNPLFRDPFARLLAGELGDQVARGGWPASSFDWVVPIRTHLLDTLIVRTVASGIRTVLNLAAGLDARPYRLAIPHAIDWIEVDFPELIAHKESVMKGTPAACAVRRIGLDLTDRANRTDLLREIARKTDNALVITEGLLIYLSEDQVAGLAEDLAGAGSFSRWLTDLQTPALLRALQRSADSPFDRDGPPLRFGLAQGSDFFHNCGWRVLEAHSMLRAAADAGRVRRSWADHNGKAKNKIDGFVCAMEPGTFKTGSHTIAYLP